jgi:hypothetical protein
MLFTAVELDLLFVPAFILKSNDVDVGACAALKKNPSVWLAVYCIVPNVDGARYPVVVEIAPYPLSTVGDVVVPNDHVPFDEIEPTLAVPAFVGAEVVSIFNQNTGCVVNADIAVCTPIINKATALSCGYASY